MKFFLILLYVSVFLSVSPYTRAIDIDSLLQDNLSRCPSSADSITELCEFAWNLTPDTFNYNRIQAAGALALNIALSTNDSANYAIAYDAASKGYFLKQEYAQAKKLYKLSLYYGERYGHINTLAWENFNLQMIALAEAKYDSAELYARAAFKAFENQADYENASKCYWILIKKAPGTLYTDSLIREEEHWLSLELEEEQLIWINTELARLYNIKEQGKTSMAYIQRVLDLAETTEDQESMAATYYLIANYFNHNQKDYATALRYYTRVEQLYIELGRCATSMADIEMQIGAMHEKLGDDQKALHYFNKGLEAGVAQNHRHTKASAYKHLGELSYNNGSYDEASHYYLQCFMTGCDECPEIKFHDALIRVGEIYIRSGDYALAKKYLNKSLRVAARAENDWARTISLKVLGELYALKGAYAVALKYTREAYAIASTTGFIEGHRDATRLLSEIYKKQGDFVKAFHFQSISIDLADSLQRINEADNLARLETYFDFKDLQTEREMAALEAENEIARQKLLRNTFIIGFLLLAISAILILLLYRRKRRDNRLLFEQKQDIEQMSKRVHEADQAKLQFFTNVSHELRTPLTLILGIAAKIKESSKHASHHNDIGMLRKNAIRLLQLINHLLDLRKLDASALPLQVQKGSLNDLLMGLTGSFESLASQKEISINFQSKGDFQEAYFDSDKLEKILTNLLSNAVKYTPVGGKINVLLQMAENQQAEIIVRDTGVGISEEDLKHIFDRFYRVSEGGVQGTGIGLTLVKDLVSLHKGSISATSVKGEGSLFKVSLPVHGSCYSVEEQAANTTIKEQVLRIDQIDCDDSTPVENKLPNLDKVTLLIVEDNRDLREFISKMFMGDYEILQAEDGQDGLQLAEEHVPDLIISDIVMPYLSGVELLEKLRKNPATLHIPVILLTANNDISSRMAAFERGADEYISKPFESEILKSRVENLLRLRRQLADKFSRQFQLEPRDVHVEDADKQFVQKTINIIEKYMAEPNLNVDLLAMELGVSRTQLYRKLKALTDYSANQFIRIIRLKRAAQILKQGQNNIAEVMDATGFSNYSYFNNCFRELFGVSPKDYALSTTEISVN